MGWIGHLMLIAMIFTAYAWNNPNADMIALTACIMYVGFQLYFYKVVLPGVRRERKRRDEKGEITVGEKLTDIEEARGQVFIGSIFILGLVGVAGGLLGFWDGSGACTGLMRYQC